MRRAFNMAKLALVILAALEGTTVENCRDFRMAAKLNAHLIGYSQFCDGGTELDFGHPKPLPTWGCGPISCDLALWRTRLERHCIADDHLQSISYCATAIAVCKSKYLRGRCCRVRRVELLSCN